MRWHVESNGLSKTPTVKDTDLHMTTASITMLEQRAIEAILEMGGGYVLDFSDRGFATFFREHGVDIDDQRFSIEGTSKAKRLRYFLKTSAAPLCGRALAGLIEHRLASKPEGIRPNDLEIYRKTVARLGGRQSSTGTESATAEADLLRHVFRRDVFTKLPVEAPLIPVLLARMEEAQRCISAKANLAAVIICGSVLEGMCLGFGSRHPELVNRAFIAQYNKPAPTFPEWKLAQWVEVLGRMNALSPNIEKFGQALRDFRNYVHPAEQLAHRFSPDEHTARIGFQVVVAAADDLVRASKRT